MQLKLPLKTLPKKGTAAPAQKTLSPSCALLIAACALSTTSTPTTSAIVELRNNVDARFPLSLNKTSFCVVFLFDVCCCCRFGLEWWKVTSESFWPLGIDFYLAAFSERKCTKTNPPPPPFKHCAGDSTPHVSYKGKRGH